MKARQENGKIVKYKKVPSTYTKSNGAVILNFNKADTETLEAEGFYDVQIDSYNPKSEELGNIIWDSENNVFKREKSDKTFTESLAELKEKAIAELDKLQEKALAPTDWVYIKSQEISDWTIPSEIITERSDIRAKKVSREAEINALQTVKEVAEYSVILFDPIDPLADEE